MKKRILSFVLTLLLSVSVIACGSKETTADPMTAPAQNTENTDEADKSEGPDTTINTPTPETTPEPVKRPEYADGTTLRIIDGDLDSVWTEISEKLDINLESVEQGDSESEEPPTWEEQLQQAEVLSGTATLFSEAGAAGDMVNIAEYLDYMPNFKAVLEENPMVRFAITGDINTGAIYYAPNPEGINDIERMPFMKTEWVEKLLNGEGAFEAETSGKLTTAVYTPYMPTNGQITVAVVKADGSGTESVKKNYDAAGNIVQTMNDALAAGEVTGAEAVNMLRDYIDKAYNGYYGTNRADLFLGQNAAWDADEFTALLRCVVANSNTLNGSDTVLGLLATEDDSNQDKSALVGFAGVLFGVRGLESEQDYLYVGAEGSLCDARQEAETYEVLEKMNAMVQEGLITSVSGNPENTAGFAYYGGVQIQTASDDELVPEEVYQAVMIPVACWYDGTDADGVYMRFTESRNFKVTEGIGISKKSVGDNKDKLFAALAMVDYVYGEDRSSSGFNNNPALLSEAVARGVIRRPELTVTENPWYTSMITILPNTAEENRLLDGFTELNFGGSTSLAVRKNIFRGMIDNGYAGAGVTEMEDAQSAAQTTSRNWGGSTYLVLKQIAWDRLITYYEALMY